MSSDDWLPFVFILGFLLLVVAVPFAFVSCIVSCGAFAKTKKWDRQRRDQVEEERLVEEPEDDFLDTEDEEDYNTQKAEETAEQNMTFWQKFGVEYKREMNGSNSRRLAKKKEREEKKKMAKAVARQVDRLQRRRDQDQNGAGPSAAAVSEDIELTSYNKATELPTKHQVL